ncbi:MAG: hypothetical protein ABSE62_09610 [Chthoniobacteraceae bacterium]|jgi:hypothetical protein
MKSISKSSPALDRYSMIEPLEQRIAPAAAVALTNVLPAHPTFVTVTAGGSLLLKAGDVLTTGSGGGGIYLMYVEQGQVLVHTTDLNDNGQIDFNEITGLSMGGGARLISFVDIHGDVVTDLNPNGTLTDNGKGDILLDANIAEIDMRSLTTVDFSGTLPSGDTPAYEVSAHLAMTSYSIFGNIYAGGGLGLAGDSTSGLHINPNGISLMTAKYSGANGSDLYAATEPVIGSIYVGSSASGQNFGFGSSGQATDINGALLAFDPLPGEAGASIYNIQADIPGTAFSIGTIHAGNGGFNAAGGSIVNVALDGDNSGVYQLIAGNAGSGTIGHNGGNIVNFSEAGAIVGEVVLQSGNGGSGLTGAGGNAGIISFNPAAPIEINAHFVINYGSGGDGYSAAGAGGGTSSGNFITPEGLITQATTLVSTYHAGGSIGSTQPFDFVGNGFSDVVFATVNPSQLVVALGEYASGAGAANGVFTINHQSYIYLNSPPDVESITVGNFTGLVNPVTHQPELDIAVAAGTGSFAGVYVYLSEYNSKTGAFEGFSDPIFNPLPILSANSDLNTPVGVSKIIAGNFTGAANGIEGLAVLAQETAFGGGMENVLIFLSPEINTATGFGTGHVFADFSNGQVPYYPVASVATFSPTQSTFLATALQQGASQDMVVYSNYSDTGVTIIRDEPGAGAHLAGGAGFGDVLIPGNPPTPTQFYDFSFTITQDITTSTNADIVAVSQSPQGFLVTMQGDGTGDFTVNSGGGINFAYQSNFAPAAIATIPNSTGLNTGINSDVAVLDYDTSGADLIYILPLEVVTPATPPMSPPVEQLFSPVPAPLHTIAPNARSQYVAFGVYEPHPAFSSVYPGSGPGEFGFITANPDAAYPDYPEFAINQPIGPTTGLASPYVSNQNTFFTDSGYFLTAGNGGNSQDGAGGAGGSFGQSLTLATNNGFTTGTGTLSILFPQYLDFYGTVSLLAGEGGNGFTNGGAGGSIGGVSVSYNPIPATADGATLLIAGDGGEGLTGTGGAGGSLSQMFVYEGEFFLAGDGGIGMIGGRGGSILGNTQPGVITAATNNEYPYVVVQAGNGATGIDGGGDGGSINSFVNWFNPLVSGTGGLLNYVGGNAGNAVAGHGGTGGSVINSSPYMVNNNLVGDIYLAGGEGGSGLYGGGGGSVTSFTQASTIKDIPTSVTVIGGAGGSATLGVGGAGGDISNVFATASGLGTIFVYDFSNRTVLRSALEAQVVAIPITYDRFVAGPGGISLGGSGGAGGAITTVQTTATGATSQSVLAAGAGGNGLNAGGAGGSLTSINADAGSTSGKVVVIAGDGGAALGGKPVNPNNPSDVANSMGAVSGPGGNGGSIVDFTQPLSVQTDVDLIAGNGGNTPNHSVYEGNASTDNSGHGGSIINVSVAGTIGNMNPNTPIISYDNVLNPLGVIGNGFGGFITGVFTMQDFVNDYILGDAAAPMTDATGSVGLVAGAAGYVNGPLVNGLPSLIPSFNGVNGSVSNVFAEQIMSMVAGNVNNVALIQSVTNYGSTISGKLGASKDVWYNPLTLADQYSVGATLLGAGPGPGPDNPDQLNYIGQFGGNIGGYSNSPLPGGGELIDGAIAAISGDDSSPSIREFIG